MIRKLFAATTPKPPELSTEDDLYTRNLLFGTAASIGKSELAKIDSARDIRVLVLTDVPCIDYPFYDSHASPGTSQGHSPQQPLASPCTLLDEMPTFQSLQECVFGSSRIKYNGPVTKLHPFPIQQRDNHPHQPRQKWLVSRIFRLTKLRNGKVKNADYTCAICVVVESGRDDQSSLTSYWTELTAGLVQLQGKLNHKLAQLLPMTYKELTYWKPFTDPYLLHEMRDFEASVDSFKARFMDAVRIPRVVCGQQRWPELLVELKWAYSSFDTTFLTKSLAAFIKHSSLVTKSDTTSVHQLLRTPQRTVVIADKESARRFIFILSMLVVSHTTPTPYTPKPPPSRDSVPIRNTSSSSSLGMLPIHESKAGGWEIPKSRDSSHQVCGFTGHVINPSFSSSSLMSLSTSVPGEVSGVGNAVSRLSALSCNGTGSGSYNSNTSNLRRGGSIGFNSPASLVSSLSNGVFSTSLLSNLFPSSVDRDEDNDRFQSTGPQPLSRYPERTATSLGGGAGISLGLTQRSSRRRRSSDLSTSLRSVSLSSSSTSLWSSGTGVGTIATSVDDGPSHASASASAKQGHCIDIPALDDHDHPFDTEYGDRGFGGGCVATDGLMDLASEEVLAPVAGHNDAFAPDFLLQAIPPPPHTGEFALQYQTALLHDPSGTKTLVIDLGQCQCQYYSLASVDVDVEAKKEGVEFGLDAEAVKLALDRLLAIDNNGTGAGSGVDANGILGLKEEVENFFGLLG